MVQWLIGFRHILTRKGLVRISAQTENFLTQMEGEGIINEQKKLKIPICAGTHFRSENSVVLCVSFCARHFLFRPPIFKAIIFLGHLASKDEPQQYYALRTPSELIS